MSWNIYHIFISPPPPLKKPFAIDRPPRAYPFDFTVPRPKEEDNWYYFEYLCNSFLVFEAILGDNARHSWTGCRIFSVIGEILFCVTPAIDSQCSWKRPVSFKDVSHIICKLQKIANKTQHSIETSQALRTAHSSRLACKNELSFKLLSSGRTKEDC